MGVSHVDAAGEGGESLFLHKSKLCMTSTACPFARLSFNSCTSFLAAARTKLSLSRHPRMLMMSVSNTASKS